MTGVQSFLYKCTYCGRKGKYIASSFYVALDYKCPHDGAKLMFQEPIETVATADEVAEYTNKLSDEVVNKIASFGL